MTTKQAPSIRVLVVDDHRTFAEAVALALGLEKGFAINVAYSAREGIERAGLVQPDVVLMDLEMPGMGGIEAIRQIRQVVPEGLVMVLSGHEEDLLMARALEAGAVGYIPKRTPLTDISGMVKRAHRGELVLDAAEGNRLSRLLRHRRHQESTQRQRANRLTPRQIEILQMMSDGVSPQEIADGLGISRLTLRTHVQNILTRLGVHTKIEAVAMAIRHGKVTTGV